MDQIRTPVKRFITTSSCSTTSAISMHSLMLKTPARDVNSTASLVLKPPVKEPQSVLHLPVGIHQHMPQASLSRLSTADSTPEAAYRPEVFQATSTPETIFRQIS